MTPAARETSLVMGAFRGSSPSTGSRSARRRPGGLRRTGVEPEDRSFPLDDTMMTSLWGEAIRSVGIASDHLKSGAIGCRFGSECFENW